MVPVLALTPIVTPFLSARTGVHLGVAVAGLIEIAWNVSLNDSGQMTEKFEEQYTEIDLKSAEFNKSLDTYESEQKETVQQKIDEYIKNYVPPAQTVTESKTNQSIPAQKGLIDVMKASATESIEQQKILNNNLTALNGTLASLLNAKNSELVNKNQANAILSENLLALNKSMATLATLPKVTAEVNTSPNISNTVKMTPKFDVVMQNNIDTKALVEANQVIASGVEDQKATNAKIVEKIDKQMEHYDFLKDGTIELKDSNGDIIKPREVQAKKDAEKFIDQKDINTTTMDEIMEFNQDVLQFLDDYSPENLFSDALGSTDGFVAELNPLSFFYDILKEDYVASIKKQTPTP